MPHFVQNDGKVHGVAIGCRRADGRWLIVRRSQFVALPGKVCFPGGGIESGETQEQACIREAREELGIGVTPVRQVWRNDYVERGILLWGWLARLERGAIVPDPAEIAEVMWMTPEELLAHPDGIVTNKAFIEALEVAADEVG